MDDSTLAVATDFLKNWVERFLSENNSSLGNFPPCPYAKRAILQDMVLWSICRGKNHLRSCLEEAVIAIEAGEKQVGIVIYSQPAEWSRKDLDLFVDSWREEYIGRDMYLMRDHPDHPETVNGLCMNNGRYLLFFVQRLSDLLAARGVLKESGYYSSWKEDEINLVRGPGDRF